MLRSKLCSNSQGGTLFTCCIAYEDPSESKIDRRLIGPPMDFRHLAHMGSGGSTSVTSSIISGVGLDDSSPLAPISTHLKLIDLSEALAVHNASAAIRLASQSSENTSDYSPPQQTTVKQRVSDSSTRERRKSSATSRYLISGPLPPPPPPPPPSALIA
ncbi:unnamed protein product [Hymenolepis diminuta]|uniref:CRIB domain-containing protein n=1 Tax=Hymenolepis diminuta TaxID=6216 RepID=A0A0R3SUC3_HYMDI|nr:unnamed protein product [Hymenolepis diminuta]VUZ38999.1 unnamed protein product [Hymenolepis diminuta]